MNNKNALIGVLAAVIIVAAGGLWILNRHGSPRPATAIEGAAGMQPSPSPSPSAELEDPPGSLPEVTEEGLKTVREFAIVGANFKFEPGQIRVNKGDIVRVTFKNASGNHDWRLDEFDAKTKILPSGQSQMVEFVADKSGTFEYYCSVGTHRAMGMKGTLVVE